jgi:hypothetical protein
MKEDSLKYPTFLCYLNSNIGTEQKNRFKLISRWKFFEFCWLGKVYEKDFISLQYYSLISIYLKEWF